ncbi:putative phosphoserine aminotransferase [Armadillidium vulgare]|nr:putative phosphoserine aminotransferase [Armadillidium vulgare]
MFVYNGRKVPDNYKVILLQGGGNGQFAGVPLNLLNTTSKADYIVTGAWSEKAFKEGKKYGPVNSVFETSNTYTGVTPQDKWVLDPEASYLYYCDNETINGVEFDFIPKTRDNVPLVCDMSSNILSRLFDVSKFGVVFAGAQKNIGCAGITLVLVRDDLIGKEVKTLPFNSKLQSLILRQILSTTLHQFLRKIYVLNKVLKWVKENGGVENMEKMALEKSSMIYTIIDNSKGFYYSPIKKNSSGNEALEKKFLEEAAAEGLLALKGHRSVGGVRASLLQCGYCQRRHKVERLHEEFYEQTVGRYSFKCHVLNFYFYVRCLFFICKLVLHYKTSSSILFIFPTSIL